MSEASDILKVNVEICLKRFHWTQTRLAEEMGIKQPQLSEWLNGLTSPGLESLRKIAKAFGITISELMDSYKPPEPRVEKHELEETIERLLKNQWSAVQKYLKGELSDHQQLAESKLQIDGFISIGFLKKLSDIDPDSRRKLLHDWENQLDLLLRKDKKINIWTAAEPSDPFQPDPFKKKKRG